MKDMRKISYPSKMMKLEWSISLRGFAGITIYQKFIRIPTDKPYPWAYPPDDLEHCEDYTAKDVTNDLIDDIKKSIHIIIGYYELTFHKRSFLGLPQ